MKKKRRCETHGKLIQCGQIDTSPSTIDMQHAGFDSRSQVFFCCRNLVEVKSLGLSATWHLNKIGSYNYDYIWVYRIEGNATGGVKVDMGRKESLNTLTSSRLISAVQTLTSVLPSPPPPFQNKRTFHHWSSRARPDVKRNLAGGERRVA